jgi:drug/metabolite transporter (DMT)-like permease
MAVKETAATPLVTSVTPGWTVTLAFIFFVIFIGGASVAVRITYQELAPFWVATARFGLGALIFWVIAAVKKIPIPKGRALLGAVLYGVFGVGLSFVLMAWGLTETPASLYQILMALIPLATIFLSAVQGLESITARSILGALLAIAGIITVVGGSGSTNISIPHVIAIILAAVLVAESSVILKRFPHNPPVMTNAVSMSVGALILGAASILSGEAWTIPVQISTWMAFLYLVLFVTVIAFLLYIFVLGKWSASRTSYGFVLTPLVTVLVAAVIAGEVISINFVLGAAFVLAGVLVGALLPGKKIEAQEACQERSGQALPRCV